MSRFFDTLDEGTEGEAKPSLEIRFVCGDMWKPYLNVIARRCLNALNILDRFHVKGHSENLTDKQAVKLRELLRCNLRVVRAYLMKEDFERFWFYRSWYFAGRFLDEWCVRAMRSKIEPMKKFVGTIRSHRELLLNWFKSKGLSSGIVEGFNNKVKLTVRKGYGYSSDESLKITLFHALGKLPEPKFTHRFW